MKKIFPYILFATFGIFIVKISSAQTNTFPATGAAGIGTITPDASSLLEVKSTTKGVLIPRMTKTQRDAIVAPATGLLIYQTNSTPGFYYYSGASWTAITPKSNSWSLTGNSGTNPSTNFIGTTDAEPFLFKANNQKSGYISTNFGDGNTGFGYQTLKVNTGAQNAAFGYGSLALNTTGAQNTAVGYTALGSNTTGNYNAAVGFQSLVNNTQGIANTSMGFTSLFSNTTGNYNTATGWESLYSNTTGGGNTATGPQSLFSNSTGVSNSAFGYQSLYYNTTGHNNSGIGNYSLFSNTTGFNNIANGYQALYFNSTGNDNTATGIAAMSDNGVGSYNVAYGDSSLYSNAYGNYNAAFGFQAMNWNLSGSDNTGVGAYSLWFNSNGVWNTAVGEAALSAEYGSYNTAVGTWALSNSYDGTENVAVGESAFISNQSGSGLTGIGSECDVSNYSWSNSIALGYLTYVTSSNQTVIGNEGASVIGGTVGWSTISDGRFKIDIRENVPGLTFINKLKPITYHLQARKLAQFTGKPDNSINKLSVAYDQAENRLRTGFVAQDVEQSAREIGYDFDGVNTPQSDKDHYSLVYSDFIPSLVKAVQELSEKNDAKDSVIASLQLAVSSLQKEMDELKTAVSNQPASISYQRSAMSDGQVAMLYQNAPNPFNQNTTIKFTLPSQFSSAQITISNLTGTVLRNFNLSSGMNQIVLQASEFSTGSYQYTLLIDGKVIDSKQMILTK